MKLKQLFETGFDKDLIIDELLKLSQILLSNIDGLEKEFEPEDAEAMKDMYTQDAEDVKEIATLIKNDKYGEAAGKIRGMDTSIRGAVKNLPGMVDFLH